MPAGVGNKKSPTEILTSNGSNQRGRGVSDDSVKGGSFFMESSPWGRAPIKGTHGMQSTIRCHSNFNATENARRNRKTGRLVSLAIFIQALRTINKRCGCRDALSNQLGVSEGGPASGVVPAPRPRRLPRRRPRRRGALLSAAPDVPSAFAPSSSSPSSSFGPSFRTCSLSGV